MTAISDTLTWMAVRRCQVESLPFEYCVFVFFPHRMNIDTNIGVFLNERFASSILQYMIMLNWNLEIFSLYTT